MAEWTLREDFVADRPAIMSRKKERLKEGRKEGSVMAYQARMAGRRCTSSAWGAVLGLVRHRMSTIASPRHFFPPLRHGRGDRIGVFTFYVL